MNTYQVTAIAHTEAGRVFTMNTGDAVVMSATGARFLNKNGLGFSARGRFAHIASAMLRAAQRAAA